MKKIIPAIALYICFISASASANLSVLSSYTSIPDTIYVYETVTVYDTIVIHDTVYIKKLIALPVIQLENIFLAPPNENILLSTATFSENRIISNKNNNYYKQKRVKTMKLNITNFLSAAILAAQSMAVISAQEMKSTEKLTTFPMQMSIFYPMTTQGNQTVNYRYNFSLNLLYGKIGGLNGVEVSGLVGLVEGNVKGVQIAGLGAGASNMKGIQVGGLFNGAADATGIQIGGLFNGVADMKGVQIGGLFNGAADATGIQIGGLFNGTADMKGVQVGGLFNSAADATGIQISGLFNGAANVNGLQIGTFNGSNTLKGVQIGVVSVNDTIEKGVSLSLINIVKRGAYKEWSLAFADYLNVGLSYKMGIQRFYTIFTAGANFMEDKLWAFGVGFGNRTVINRRFDFQPEIVSYLYFPNDFKNVQNATANHLKLGFVYKMNDKLGISVAPSLYHFYNDYSKHQEYSKVSPISPFYKNENKNRLHSIGAGISVGLLMKQPR